jgi:hypothetical protein
VTTPSLPVLPSPIRSRPVAILLSVLAAVDTLAVLAALPDFVSLIPLKVALWIVLGNKVIQAGVTFYLHNTVTPYSSVATLDVRGQLVSGPALAVRRDELPTGVTSPIPEGRAVVVAPDHGAGTVGG